MKGFEFYQDSANEWRWRLKDENDHIVADSGEGYKDKADCKKGSELFTTLGVDAPERKVVQYAASEGGPAYEYFLDDKGKWRWHFQARNNKIIADSGSKTFLSEADVKAGIAKVRALLKSLSGGNDGGSGYVPPTTGGSTGSTRFA